MNIKKAGNQIKRMLHWRTENNMDHILEDKEVEKVEYELSKNLMYRIHGQDALGRPTTIINIGRCDLRFIMKQFSQNDIVRAHLYYDEVVDQLSIKYAKEKGYDYIGNCTIVDLEGLSVYKHMDLSAVQLLGKIVDIYSNYYPETADLVLVVNAPSIFSFFWSIISPFFSDLQKKKLKILKDYSELKVYFKEENIPAIYGGKCNCKDGCVIGKSTQNGNIHSDIVKISSGKKITVDIPCLANETTSWTLRSLKNDIAFGAVFIPRDQNILPTTVWQLQRINAQEETYTGKYSSGFEGTLQLTFDNSYSSFTAKTIAYDIIKTQDEE
ncbi:hypothetical protein WA158_005601 [Blastocystis sp. Blastoise]